MVRWVLFSSLLCFCYINAEAQRGRKNKSLEKSRRQANVFYERKDYVNALKIYEKLLEKDSLNPEICYRTGVCMYNLRNKRMDALRFFEKCDVKSYPEALFYQGNLYHLKLRFNEAITAYTTYNSVPDRQQDSALVAHLITKAGVAAHMMKEPVNVTISNIGPVINSPYPDYVPLLSADGTMMIFTSRRDNSTGKLKDLNGEYLEDIYISYKKENGWTNPVSISKNINTDMHDACVALSPDGQQLIVYRTSDDLMSGDLYLSRFTGKDWTQPEMMGSDINTEEGIEASATFSPDNSILIFSSDRAGGYGGKDLYKVVKLPNGQWSKATNLGPGINTAYDEDAPFLHSDGRTLYFSSKAHRNMGGYDIFKSVASDDGGWSSPVNVGYPINTVNDDIYFVLSVRGDKGYFSSKGDFTYGETDIYSIEFPDQNFQLAVVNCRVTGNDDSPAYVTGTLTDNSTSALVGRFTSSKETGKFIMIITPGKSYNLEIKAEGYPALNKEIMYQPADLQDNVVQLDLKLTKSNTQ
jgi:tetratricopeptide (TPR) repeat protein